MANVGCQRGDGGRREKAGEEYVGARNRKREASTRDRTRGDYTFSDGRVPDH
ncbi:hypothetical protein BC826DRAFT_1015515 [Russula brevipes]|nr:hypothetical protein BC826DRAFT_1015515 [Russula brevipes]